MGKLERYRNDEISGHAFVDLEDGDRVWITVFQATVVVRKVVREHSRPDLMDATLYKDTDLYRETNLYVVAKTAQALDAQSGEYLTPKAMLNPVLRAFTQATLECTSVAQLLLRLNKALEQAQTRDWMSDEDKEKAEIRKRIISEYINYIKNNPPIEEIRDVSELPYPKQEILDAITQEIVQEIDDKKVDAMINCGFMLADFQNNVGPKPLRLKLAKSHDYDSLRKIVKKERDSIYSKMRAAVKLRWQILETKTKAISKYDITTGIATEKGFFSKLANGDFGLTNTYWLYGVLVNVFANAILEDLKDTFASTGSMGSIGGFVILMLAITVYDIPLLMGTWRAADKYQGEKIWAILAKISVVLGAIATILLAIGLLAIIGQIIVRLNRA